MIERRPEGYWIDTPAEYETQERSKFWIATVYQGQRILAECRGDSPETAKINADCYLRSARTAAALSSAKGQVRCAIRWLEELGQSERVEFLTRNLLALERE